MGIYINLNISDTVTKKEWSRAYNKSLSLVEKMPLIEKGLKRCYGADLVYAKKTTEGVWRYNGEMGWHAIGDSITMKTAENYFLPKDILMLKETGEDTGPYVDPYMSILPAYSVISDSDKLYKHVVGLWGNKTQGEPYHIYMLAVACMLEQELPGKVAIYGDITKGQCKRATEIASDILGENIEMPDRCKLQELYNRVRKMPLQRSEVIEAFSRLYLGNQDEEFIKFVRENFTDEEWGPYWENAFGGFKVGTLGFSSWLKDYLSWGFSLPELKKYVQFYDEDGKNLAEDFVKAVLYTEVYLEDKDCEDVLEIDHEEKGTYSIYTLLAKFVFAGAKNYRVNRYIPMEELLSDLIECVGDQCNVKQIIDKHLAEQNKRNKKYNPTDMLNEIVHNMRDDQVSLREEYDIASVEDLVYFENGDTIAEMEDERLLDFFTFYRSILDEKEFNNLRSGKPEEAIRFLIEQNKYLLFTEESWQKIFNEIENDIMTFERYYPMVRVKVKSDYHVPVIRALALNDDLYQYCMEKVSDRSLGD